MKKNYLVLVILFSVFCQGQNVTTFFSDPSAVLDDAMIFDSDGNLFGSNFAGNSVYKVTPNGDYSVFVSGLANPNGLAFDSQGNLFIVEYSANVIHKYASDGSLIQSYPVTDGFPSNIIKSFDSDDMIFTNVSDQSINKLSVDGSITKIYAGNPIDIPVGLTYDDNGNLYIGNYLDRKIYKLQENQVEYVATIPDSGTVFPYLAFITFAKGLLWATNYGESKIYTVDPNRLDDVSIFSGSERGTMDGDYTEATYFFPAGIVYNAEQDALYVNQYFNGSVRKITSISTYEPPKLVFKVAPNPVNTQFLAFGSLPESGDFSISVFTMTGVLAYETNGTTSGNNRIRERIYINDFSATDVSNMYVVKITTDRESQSKLIAVRQH